MPDENPDADKNDQTDVDKTDQDKSKAPTWNGDFDAERAARLVENLRADLKKKDADLADLKSKVGESGKTEKTLQERLDALESRAAKAERDLIVATAAKKHSIPDDLVDLLKGDTAEEIHKAAEALAKFAKKPAEEVRGRPRPALRNGTGTEATAEGFDPEKAAARIRRR